MVEVFTSTRPSLVHAAPFYVLGTLLFFGFSHQATLTTFQSSPGENPNPLAGIDPPKYKTDINSSGHFGRTEASHREIQDPQRPKSIREDERSQINEDLVKKLEQISLKAESQKEYDILPPDSLADNPYKSRDPFLRQSHPRSYTSSIPLRSLSSPHSLTSARPETEDTIDDLRNSQVNGKKIDDGLIRITEKGNISHPLEAGDSFSKVGSEAANQLNLIDDYSQNVKKEGHNSPILKVHQTHQKPKILTKANNELKDPFLAYATEILSKNETERISEIVSLKNRPEKFIAMFKAAQESDNFEDPFTLSSIFQEGRLNNILTADSGAFNEGQRKLHQSSFRGLSSEPKKSVRNKDKLTTSTPRTMMKADVKTEHPANPASPESHWVKDLNALLDSDVLEVGKRFRESLTRRYNDTYNSSSKQTSSINLQKGKKIIYQEISGSLHIDTSIDDIKDDYEVPAKTTETSETFLPRVNTSRSNFLGPQVLTIELNNKILPTVIIDSPSEVAQISSSTYLGETRRNNITSENFTSTNVVNSQSLSIDLALTVTDTEATIKFTTEKALTGDELRNLTELHLVGLDDGDGQIVNSTTHKMNNIQGSDVLGSNLDQEVNVENRGDIQEREGSNNRYYSFFGYTEEGTTGNSESYPSIGDHNEIIFQAQADRMLQVMNSAADPCQDFYEFACGKWAEVYPLEDKALDNTFDRLREGLDEVLKFLLDEPITQEDSNATKAAKTLYRGCMNEEQIEALGVTPLKNLLRELGGWPVIEGKSWNKTAFDWTELMANLRNFNNDILLSEWIAADITNSSQHIIQLDQPELGLPGREYFLSPGDQSYRMAYMELMLNTCQLLGADPLTALEDMIKVLQFEKQLAKILIPAEERRNLSAVHTRLTVGDLQEEIPQIDWNRYFEILTGSPDNTDRPVIVYAMKYIHRLIQLIQSTSERTVSNYLMWRFVKNRMNNLGTKALEAKQEFIQVLFGSKSQPERWLFCVSYVNGNLGHVVGALFVQKYYPQSSKYDSEKMIHLIRDSFIEAIRETDWMDKKTREIAEKKVYAMVRNVGYPQYILNRNYMDLVYSQLTFNASDHFGNVIKMLRFHAQSSHELLKKPVDRHEWTTTPAVVNAYYSRTKNMIMFPAGILQPPFYHPSFPRSLNFGGIGVVIGHEISHGFDDRGRQFDHDGNLHQWWAEEDVSHFYDRATCMLDQYSNYKIESVGLKINAVNTLGENIADNAGLKIAFKAYQRWKNLHGEETTQLPNLNFTHDQLFFLNFGQIWCEVNSPEAMLTKVRGGQHSPNKYRVIGTLSNSPEFSEAFQCPEDSPMNPKEKCQVW